MSNESSGVDLPADEDQDQQYARLVAEIDGLLGQTRTKVMRGLTLSAATPDQFRELTRLNDMLAGPKSLSHRLHHTT
jgi:hypothetical protein